MKIETYQNSALEIVATDEEEQILLVKLYNKLYKDEKLLLDNNLITFIKSGSKCVVTIYVGDIKI